MSDSPIPGMSSDELARLFSQFLAEKMGQAKPKVVFRDVWASFSAYGSSSTPGGRPRIRAWKAYSASSKHFLPFFGDLPCADITLLHVDEYRAKRHQDVNPQNNGPYAAATINGEVRKVASALSWACKRKIISENPLTGVEDEPVHNDRGFDVSDAEFLALLKASPAQLRDMLLLYHQTGMRRDETRLLQWSEVDLEAGFIKLRGERTKNGQDREIVLTTVARMVLEMQRNDGLNPYVFANPRNPTGAVPASTLWKWFDKARTAAGITGPRGQAIWVHTFRHTWATNGITSGLDIETLMSMGGWSDVRTMKIYMNIQRRHKDGARAQLDHRAAALSGLLGRGPKRAGLLTAPAEPTAPRKAAKRADKGAAAPEEAVEETGAAK